MIRWSHGDYIRLGKAVSEFNKAISKNETEVNKLHLPETVNYKELRDNIQTREGLNAYIQSLKRVNNEGAFDLEELESGEIITKYQKRELERSQAQALNSLAKEAAKAEARRKLDLGLEATDILKPSQYTQEQKDIQNKMADYRNLFKLKGEQFKTMAKYLGINQTELKYRRAYVFRKNYMNEMKKYEKFPAYKLFLAWANKHKNPVDFYESLPDDNFYPDDLHYQSTANFSEEDFEAFLEVLGIDVSEELKKRGAKQGLSEYDYKEKLRAEIKQKQTIKEVKQMFKGLK